MIDDAAAPLTIDDAELMGFAGIAVACDHCGVQMQFPFWQLRRKTRRRRLSEISAALKCRQCGAAPSSTRLMRPAPVVGDAVQLPFAVEEWSADRQHVVEILALSANGIVGRAAFEAAKALRPGRWITLRSGIRLIASSEP